jgi:hypothetical protein
MYDSKIIMLTIIVIHNIGNQACALHMPSQLVNFKTANGKTNHTIPHKLLIKELHNYYYQSIESSKQFSNINNLQSIPTITKINQTQDNYPNLSNQK